MKLTENFNNSFYEVLDTLNIPHRERTSWFLPKNCKGIDIYEAPMAGVNMSPRTHHMATDGELLRIRLCASKGLGKGWSVKAEGQFDNILSSVRREVNESLAKDFSAARDLSIRGPYIAGNLSKEEAMGILRDFEVEAKANMQSNDYPDENGFMEEFYDVKPESTPAVRT